MIEKRKIAEIRVGERHRKACGDLDRLAASIEDIGLLHPVVITPDETLIAGQRRLAACKLLNWTEIPVHVVDLAEVVLGEAAENMERIPFQRSEMASIAAACRPIEARKAAERKHAALNRGSEKGKPAPHRKKGKTRDVMAKWFGVSGKTLEKIEKVMSGPYDDLKQALDAGRGVNGVWLTMKKRRLVEAVRAEELPVLNKTIRPASIVCGDCQEMLKDIPDATFHAVVTDPPFGIGFDYGAWQDDIDDPHAYGRWIIPIFEELKRVLKPGGFLCLWQVSKYIPYFGHWFGEDFHIHAFCQTHHTFRMNAKFNYFWQPAVVWYKPGARELQPEKPTRTVDFFLSDCKHDEFAEQHPAPKPLDLCRSIISSFVIDGGYVLDPFCGAGTIPLACKQLGRHYLGIEIAAKHCELAELRIRKYGGGQEGFIA